MSESTPERVEKVLDFSHKEKAGAWWDKARRNRLVPEDWSSYFLSLTSSRLNKGNWPRVNKGYIACEAG